jgi:fermentation-respiration switch protein FrsA (DUF1100 family)
VLVIHSPDDEIIPYKFGQQLFEAANEPKKFLEVSGLHNDHAYMQRPEYHDLIDFLCR